MLNFKSYTLFLGVVLLGFVTSASAVKIQSASLLDSAKHIFRAQPEKALLLLKEVKKNATQTRDYKSIVQAEVIVGNVFYFKGDHDKALQTYLQALKIAEAAKLLEEIALVCNEIGTLHKKNKNLGKAIAYYERALAEAVAVKNDNQIANAHNNIGLTYEEQRDFKKALKQYQQSLLFYQRAKDKLGESYSLEYIGYVYGLMKNYEPAIANLKQSLALRSEIKDNYGIAINLIELTEVNRDKKDYPEALTYAKRAINFSKEVDYPDMLQNGYLLLSGIYERQGDLNKAYQTHKEYVNVKDSLFNIEKSKQINELQTQYDTEKKEQKIALLNRENTIQKLKLIQRDALITIVSIAFLLFAFIFYLLYNRYKLRQNSRLQEEVILQQDLATKAVLNAEENERRRIAVELHDGLGQLFSAVKLNLSAISEHITFTDHHDHEVFKKTVNLVDESCKEVRVISHQMAPNVLLKAGLTSAIRDFIDNIDSRKLKVNLSAFGLQQRLEENIEIVLYRVIQETVNNVIKHANANTLDIQLSKDEEGVSVMIEDNGRGFDSSQREKFEGIGLKNIVSRVAYLKGTVDFSSHLGRGTLVAIFIPFGK